jgi:hypothetical protein
MRTRSSSPRVRTQAELWIYCRGHQDASPSKRITAFGWVDRRKCGHQSRAAVLVVRAARDGGSLGRGMRFRG